MKPEANTRRLLQITVLLIVIIVIVPGCDPIRSFIDDLIKEDPISTKTIGPAGGELDFNGLIISIPRDAFTGENNVSITETSGTDEFGDNAASSLYLIDGMPSNTKKTIKIKVEYSGTIEGDTLIAIGEMMYAVSRDSTLMSYRTEKAVDSSGYLVYDLQPYNKPLKAGSLKSGPNKNIINIMALTAMTTVHSSNKHFSIKCPLLHKAQAVKMAQYFEDAHDTCYNMGFRYKVGKEDYKWPLKVTVKGLDPETSGQYCSLGSDNMDDEELLNWVKDGRIEINKSIINNDLELRTTCGHEFLHFVQNIYEFSPPDIEPEQAWLEEATAVWIEEKYANTPDYYSSSFKTLENYIFNGIQYADIGYSKHGYGLPFIIKEIAEKYGDGAVFNIHKKIKDGILPGSPVDPLDAVFSVINEPVEDFFFRVCSLYLAGHYYNKNASMALLKDAKANYPGMWFNENDKNFELSYDYPDLSAQLYWATGTDFGSMTKVPISMSVDQPDSCGILVFKHKAGNELEWIGKVEPGRDGVIIFSDLLPVFNDGYELAILVVNTKHDKTKNYQSKNRVNLKMEIVSGMTSGSVEFYLDQVVFKRDDQNQPYTDKLEEVLHLHHLTGSLNNNVYSGSYYYKSLGRTFSGDVRITFQQDPERLDLHLDHHMSFKGSLGFGERKYHYTVDYNDLPYEKFESWSGNWIYYQSGSSVSKMSISWEEKNNYYTQELKSINCGSSAYIRVAVDAK